MWGGGGRAMAAAGADVAWGRGGRARRVGGSPPVRTAPRPAPRPPRPEERGRPGCGAAAWRAWGRLAVPRAGGARRCEMAAARRPRHHGRRRSRAQRPLPAASRGFVRPASAGVFGAGARPGGAASWGSRAGWAERVPRSGPPLAVCRAPVARAAAPGPGTGVRGALAPTWTARRRPPWVRLPGQPDGAGGAHGLGLGWTDRCGAPPQGHDVTARVSRTAVPAPSLTRVLRACRGPRRAWGRSKRVPGSGAVPEGFLEEALYSSTKGVLRTE